MLPIETGKENTILRKPSEPVDDFNGKLQTLIKDMQTTLTETENGIGLAAPQVGKNIRLFVISSEFADETSGHLVFVNPHITDRSRKTILLEEGCLSLPDYWAELPRPAKVTIKAQDEYGEKFKLRAKGLLARLFSHEVDHLDGMLFVDHLKQ